MANVSWSLMYPADALASAATHILPCAADAATGLSGKTADDSMRWVGPYKDVPVPRHTRIETADGGVRVYKIGQDGQLIVLQWSRLPEGSASSDTDLYGYLGLKQFLLGGPEWGLKTFDFYPHGGLADGAGLTVRYVSGIQSFRLIAGTTWAGSITLRKELS